MPGKSVSRRSISISRAVFQLYLAFLTFPYSNFYTFNCRQPKQPNCKYFKATVVNNCMAYICTAQRGEECTETLPCDKELECRCNECRLSTDPWICPEMVKEIQDQPQKRLQGRFPLWFQRARWQNLPQKYLEPEYKD